MQTIATPNRREKTLNGLSPEGLGLEIGASIRPMVTREQGYNVRTLDHLDQVGLVEKYKDDPGVDVSVIGPVDYVWSGQPFSELVGAERFDWIVASHVIEHVPDLIGFIRDCTSILADDGVLSLVIPDKRFEFDFFRPQTGVARVIDAFLRGDKRPTTGAVAEFALYVANKHGSGVWNRDARATLPEFLSDPRGLHNLLALVDAGEYRDCHVWCFTPSGFRLMITDLNTLGYIELRESAFFDTEGFEFFVQLSRKGEGSGLDRRSLAASALHEVF